MAVRFGAFEVDLASGELRKQGLRIRLQEQPFAVLAALLERPGEVVTREELTRILWPDGTVVDFDRGLNAAVTRLRQALSDSAETPRYVETVARRGYRFIGTVDAPPPAEAGTPKPSPKPKRFRRWPAAAVAAVALVVLGYWVTGGRSIPAEPAGKATPLTTEQGFESHVSFSPEGTQVTFEWDSGGQGRHVYVKVVGPGEPIRLTSGAAAEFGPAWSPNGKWIAFLRDLGGAMWGVFVIPALGGVERKVTEMPAPPYWVGGVPLRRLCWTADSNHLIVSGPEQVDGFERLFVVSIETREKRWLTPGPRDREPAMSRDGRTLAFVRGALESSAMIQLLPMRPDLSPAGDPKPLTPGRNPAWTPDGREIVFCTLKIFGSGLALVGIASGAPRDLGQYGDGGFLPAISRTGRLAFSRGTEEDNVWRQEITDKAAAPPPVPLLASTARDEEAEYSPDGSRIAFRSNRSGNLEIWTCRSNGSPCGQLTAFNGPFITGSPRWSPDGTTVAFDSAAEGQFNVYTIDAAGGSPRRLTSNPAGGAIASWSQDGNWIYYASTATGRFEIWKIPRNGGTPAQVTRNGGFVAVESDGALYYTKTDNDDATLWKAALDGAGETKVVEGVAHRGFALTRDGVYYLRTEPDGEAIRHLRFATGEDRQVARLAKRAYLGLSVSPDGRYLIYSQIDQQGSDLMLVDRFR